MSKYDEMSAAMKVAETESGCTLYALTNEYLYIRVDGRHFHTWVKQNDCEFCDIRMIVAMETAMQAVAKDLGADVAYTQSDEASFGWFAKPNPQSQFPFGGKAYKLVSVIASMFNGHFINRFGSVNTVPSFDGRLVTFPEKSEFQTMFYWRYLDAKRNAVNSFAQQHYSHRKLQGIKLRQVKEMLENDGLLDEFNRLPAAFREGSFYLAANPYEQAFVDQPTFRDAFLKA